MHENFGKTVDQIRQSLQTMRAGCHGNEAVNAVEAWEAGTGAAKDAGDQEIAQ